MCKCRICKWETKNIARTEQIRCELGKAIAAGNMDISLIESALELIKELCGDTEVYQGCSIWKIGQGIIRPEGGR